MLEIIDPVERPIELLLGDDVEVQVLSAVGHFVHLPEMFVEGWHAGVATALSRFAYQDKGFAGSPATRNVTSRAGSKVMLASNATSIARLVSRPK